MRLGDRELRAWLAGSAVHQLFDVDDGLLYRFLPTLARAERHARRDVLELLAEVLRTGTPGLPSLLDLPAGPTCRL